MTFGIILLLFFWLVYHLLVKGVLWKLILVIFGWFGLFVALGAVFPSTVDHGIIVSDVLLPWCMVIPSIIVLLALACTKAE